MIERCTHKEGAAELDIRFRKIAPEVYEDGRFVVVAGQTQEGVPIPVIYTVFDSEESFDEFGMPKRYLYVTKNREDDTYTVSGVGFPLAFPVRPEIITNSELSDQIIDTYKGLFNLITSITGDQFLAPPSSDTF